MKLIRQFPRIVIDAILVAMAAMGAVFCVVTSFSLNVSMPVIVLVAVLSAILFACCFHWKPMLPVLLVLGIVAVVLGITMDLFAPVLPTLQQLSHDILQRFSSAYPNFSFVIPPAPEPTSPQSATLVFSLFAMLIALWMAWGVGYRSCLISVAGTLPFLLLCVTINDTPPHVLPLILLLSVWLTVLLCKERPEEPVAMDTARLSIMLMAVLLLVGIVGTVYPKDNVEELPSLVQDILDRLPDDLQSVLSRDSERPKEEQAGADVDDVLDLTTLGARNRTDSVMLQISVSSPGVLYLKGAAKDVYTGDRWESRDQATVEESIYAHTSLGTAFGDSYQAAVQVRNVGDSATVAFVPYGFLSCTGMEDIQSDLRIGVTTDDYINYYWPDISGLDLTVDYGYVNEAYDAYVQETCLDVPEGTREILYDLAISYGYDPNLSTLDTIAWVAEFCKTIGTYKLNVSRQPLNYDFAVYFLTESRTGYCVHFATAAAVLYRTLGLPARYVSGYRAEVADASGITDVTDQNTHAWVEVYLSGLGWIPVEVTPGFGSTLSLPDVEHQPELQAGAEEPVLPSPSPEPETPDSSEEDPGTPEQPSPSPTPDPEPEPENASEPEPPEAGPVTLRWLLLLPVMLILLILTLWIRHRITLSRRVRQFRSPNTNAAVIAQWQYLEKLPVWGAKLPEDLEQLALKAKFSQHAITREELANFSAGVHALAGDTQKQLTRWQRLRFTWLHCLDWK